MKLTPTNEQTAIVDAFEFGADLVIEAGAGTGKTSTLKLLAGSTRERGVYLAYNKAIATDAGRSFPSTVLCKTAHALAFAAVGRDYKHRLDAPRVPAQEVARILGINEPIRVAADVAPLAPQQLARIVMAAIDRFCYSADDAPTAHHVPALARLDGPLRAELATTLTPWVAKAWDDLRARNGRLRFTHDVYLKMWQLSRPQLGVDYVLLDEAQDANPAVASIVDSQQAQRILVGDACQAIYGWRGAVDAMANFPGHRLYLSQSFRFGHAVAAEANKWLTLLGAHLRLRGHGPIPSTVGYVDRPDAILCRSNAGAFSRAMDAIAAGRRTALVGGGDDMRRMAQAAQRLQRGEPCDHPELLAFANWREVQEYCEETAGADLKVLVDLIDRQGADTVIAMVDRLVGEDQAQVVISTAHKAKGREWGSVRIADDFREPRDEEGTGLPGPIPRDDAMLAYVAVTRAKLELDRDGLWWVDRHLQWREVGQPEDEAYAAILTPQPAWRPSLPEETPAQCEPELATTPAVDEPPAAPMPDWVTKLRDTIAKAKALTPEPGAPFHIGQSVRYKPPGTSTTVFTVQAIRPSMGVGWFCDLVQPDGRVQGGVSADVLEDAADVPQEAAEEPTHAFGWPLSPDCRACRLPYLECTCPVAADRRTDAQVAAGRRLAEVA